MSVAQKDGIERSFANQISYEDLYKRWEKGNWSAYDLDFSQDREGWDALTDLQRESALWIYSMFFFGEDSVTDNLSPYIDAAPKEEQKYFLATQQVDEARHAVFFHRFFKEVIGRRRRRSPRRSRSPRSSSAGATATSSSASTEWPTSCASDRSLPKFAQAITLYHLVVEATLAQPGPALHRGLLRQGGHDAGIQRRDVERLARRAAPHRLRRQGPLASSSPSPTSARRRCARSCSTSCPTPWRCSCRPMG